jgi:hypothetical protein
VRNRPVETAFGQAVEPVVEPAGERGCLKRANRPRLAEKSFHFWFSLVIDFTF